MGRRAKPAKVKAKRPLVRKAPTKGAARVHELEQRLAEALQREVGAVKREAEVLDQQTATSELLKVIGRSAFDLQPVFETLVENARRLCEAERAFVHRFDGQVLRVVATHNVSPELRAFVEQNPFPVGRHTVVARAGLERGTIHIHDVDSDPEITYYGKVVEPVRTALAVPMLRAGELLGVIMVYRHEVRPFTDGHIALLKTFADQAVIAIENVRRFNETKEALEQQTATSGILRVISSSPTDAQPVFDTIVRSSDRLLGGLAGSLALRVGDEVHLVALTPTNPEGDAVLRHLYPMRIGEDGGHAEVVRLCRPLMITDTEAELTGRTREFARIRGFRSRLSVPLIRDGLAIGSLGVTRPAPGAFTEREIALLQTFADQAVIAIENVRLFTELQVSNRELTSALDTQTATSDILGVISRSQTDVQPVFDAIVQSARRLLNGFSSSALHVVGDQLRLAANTSTNVEGDAAVRALCPIPLNDERMPASWHHVLSHRQPHVVIDTDTEYSEQHRQAARARGYRSQVIVPMLREGVAVGLLFVTRVDPGRFDDTEIELLKTFAEQAVIAIENVRLFTELQTSNGELTTALDTQTATSDILRVISGSQTDVQPVFDAILSSAVRLLGAYGGALTRVADDQIVLAALTSTDEVGDAALRAAYPRPLQSEGAHAQAIRARAPVNIADYPTDARWPEAARDNARIRGYRSQVMVPLLRGDEAIGAIAVSRREPGGFTGDEIALLQTFADQAVIAIENARLFRELEQTSHQLAAASQHKSEFLANMSHELRTPLNAIIGYSEMLQEEAVARGQEPLVPDLQKIDAAGRHLLELINDILDLSKIEAGRMELEPTEFDLPTAIDNALTLVRERASRRGIALGHSIDARLGMIRADERKVKQVLLNLLSNALKFTPEGGRIEVRAAMNEGMLDVSVTDTGVGIAPEDQEAVFEEFRQVGTAEKKAEGTGLGLALARKFIELHGGRIWVQSQIGHGSTFTFTLPLSR